MTDVSIGTMNWYGCDDCIHCDPDEGGCDVPIAQWQENLRVEGESVKCGSYDSRVEGPDGT
jgi:hypothetical protein